ncbi:MAG: hypothetical protein KDC34_02255 [Saprospiraceae bacterium]|nr:hypothetical protein [Saprospiraceae bacterium]
MKPSFRTTHKGIWLSLALAIPVLFFLALRAIPEIPINPELLPYPEGYSGAESLADDAVAEVKVICLNANNQCRLLVSLKQASAAPNTLLRLGDVRLGTLGSLKTYQYELPETYSPFGKTLEFFDQINQKTWHSIQLKSL